MKNYTDIEQSKKLTEFLPLESSDHHYVRKVCDYMGNAVDGEWSWPKYGNIDSKYANYIVQNFTSYEKIPCWSLAALFSALPEYIKFDGHTWKFYNDHYGVYYMNADTYDTNTFSINSENLVDACYELILKLNELKLL